MFRGLLCLLRGRLHKCRREFRPRCLLFRQDPDAFRRDQDQPPALQHADAAVQREGGAGQHILAAHTLALVRDGVQHDKQRLSILHAFDRVIAAL